MVRTAATPANLPALTSIRFFAAAVVVLIHYCQRLGEPSSIGFPSAAIQTLVSVGYLGLPLFFVLSGFVLAWNYATPEGDLKCSRSDFWVARVARVYPAYLLSLLVSLPVFIAAVMAGQSPPAAPPLTNPAIVAATVVTTPLLIQSWFGLIGWNSVGWSLSGEAFFYALFPLLLPRIGKLTPKGLYRAAGLACGLSMVPALFCVATSSAPVAPAPWYPIHMRTMFEGVLYASPLSRLPEFFVGIVLGRLAWLHRESNGARLPAWSDAVILPMAVPLFLATAWLPGPIFSRLHVPYIGLLVYSLAEQRGPVARLLSRPSLVYLGELSYATYLLHEPIIQTFAAGVERAGLAPWLLGWLGFAIVWTVALIAAALSYRFVEMPGRRWVRRKFSALGQPVSSCIAGIPAK